MVTLSDFILGQDQLLEPLYLHYVWCCRKLLLHKVSFYLNGHMKLTLNQLARTVGRTIVVIPGLVLVSFQGALLFYKNSCNEHVLKHKIM